MLPLRGPATRLLVVRHTEPDEQAVGRCYGSADVPLSTAGRAHADDLASRLAGEPIDVVVASPRQRAADTAAPIAARHGRPVGVVDALREMDFGDIEGRTYDDIAASMPHLWQQWMTAPTEVRFPGGESYGDLRERVQAAVASLLAEHRGETVLAVTHGGVARSILATMLGLPSSNLFRLDQQYGAINAIDVFDDGTPLVRMING